MLDQHSHPFKTQENFPLKTPTGDLGELRRAYILYFLRGPLFCQAHKCDIVMKEGYSVNPVKKHVNEGSLLKRNEVVSEIHRVNTAGLRVTPQT